MSGFRKSFGSVLLGLTLCGGFSWIAVDPSAAMAQADLGSIVGTISDSSGAVLSKATITVTNTATGAVRTGVTNDTGGFNVSQLNAGDYKLQIDASGFTSATQVVRVSVGGTNTVNIKLAVTGGQTEVIVSSDETTSVHLDKSEVSTVIQTEDVLNLPLADRNPYALVSLSGNLSSDATAASRGVGFNISGSRSASVDILMDGAENTDLYGVGIGQPIPLEATQEFRVVTANAGAEYGRASGGAVNLTTKSGTNKFHGSAFEYNRISTFASDSFNNNALYAAGNLSNPKPRYVHNQFGYFVGGPIKTEKLFFASSTEWTRIRSSQTVTAEVALPGLLGLSAATTQDFFTTYGASLAHPVNGKTYTGQDLINEGVFAKDVATLAATNPAILTTPLFGTVSYSNPGDSGGGTPQNTWNNFNRVDWTISQKTSVFFRYMQFDQNEFAGTVNTSPYAGYNTGQTQKNYNALVSLTHSFSTSVASNTKLLATRFNNAQPLGTVPVSPTLYVNGSSAVNLGSGQIYFPGYSATSPGNAIPFGGPQNFIQVGQDIDWTKGKHSFKFGGEFLNVKDNRVFGAYEEAVDGLVQTGTRHALENFVGGGLGLLQVAINPQGEFPCVRDVTTGLYNQTAACTLQLPVSAPNFSRSNRYQDGAVYATDSFKVSPRLTLNGGVRWEVYGPQHSQKPSYDANFFLGNTGNIFTDIRNGQVLTRANAPNGRLWKLNSLQFGPRIGFAYDLTGDGKTSLRGGYSLAYERNFNNVTFNVIQNPPNYGVVSFTTADNGGAPIPISTNNYAQFGTGTGAKLFPNVTLRAVDPKIKPAYAQNWTLTVERQLNPETLLSASYVGSRGIHNYSIANLNRSFSGVNYLGDNNNVSVAAPNYPYLSNRLNLQYGSINFRGADGDSYYESVTAGIRSSNLHHTGIGVIANYTYGHSIDNTSSTFTDGGSNNDNLGYLDPFNHALDRGPSDFDQRHRVVAAISWALPFFSHSNELLKSTLGGWTANTIFNANTGTPYSIFDCGFVVTVCPRVSFQGAPPRKNKNLQDISGIYGPNTYSYQNLPTYDQDPNTGAPLNYNEQVNALVNNYFNGGATSPTVFTAGSDTPVGPTNQAYGGFVHGMTGRNAFRGPGAWSDDFNLSKTFKVRERYGLELRADFINVLNHANTKLNLGGTNDVSSNPYILSFKDGNRNTELQARFVF